MGLVATTTLRTQVAGPSTQAYNVRTAATNTQAHLLLTPTHLESLPAPSVRSIVGRLPGGRRLAHPIIVAIEPDDGEVLVSEPHFHMHAAAATEAEALEAFRRVFSGYLDFLSANE